MRSSSKYASLIYQFLSGWKDKGGCSITIENFKKILGISDKYKQWTDLNAKVIRPAYKELYENADIWFEYNPVKENGEFYKIDFKIIKGYLKVIKDSNNLSLIEEDNDLIFKLDTLNFTDKEKLCFDILKYKILINDDNVVGEIISDRIDDFFVWWNANSNKVDKMENSAANLRFYLKMTSKFDWKAQKWVINTNLVKKKISSSETKYKEDWNKVCEILDNILGSNIVDTWFRPLNLIEHKDNTLIVKCPNQFIYERIERDYVEQLSCALKTIYNNSIINLKYSFTE